MIGLIRFFRDGLKSLFNNKLALWFSLLFSMILVLYPIIPKNNLILCGVYPIYIIASFILPNGILLILWNVTSNIKLRLKETIAGVGKKVGEIIWVGLLFLLILLPLEILTIYIYSVLAPINSRQVGKLIIWIFPYLFQPIMVFALLSVFTSKNSFTRIISNSFSTFFHYLLTIILVLLFTIVFGSIIQISVFCFYYVMINHNPMELFLQLRLFTPLPVTIPPIIKSLAAMFSILFQYPIQSSIWVQMYKKYNKPEWFINIESKQNQKQQLTSEKQTPKEEPKSYI